MRKLSLLGGAILFPFLTLAQNPVQKENIVTSKLDSVVVQSTRAGKNTPVAFSKINSTQLRSMSPLNSVPMALSLMPSVVSSTEGGNGLGYSSMRVRGSDASRINVTINGIALNDAESQEVFWVNLPALSGFLSDIQLQRGVGTSVNGAGAFGASINMQTVKPSSDAYGSADLSVGSYKSVVSSIAAGTGLLPGGYYADVKYSFATGEGYIRNAKSRLNSLYTTLGWRDAKTDLKLNYMFGDQKTGITWNGVPREMLEIDRRYNPAGEYKDAAGNIRYYDNETDNYTQHHFQLFFSRELSSNLSITSSLNFTKGDGYYENYKANKKFSSYGLPSQVVNGVTYKKSDLIIRQLMDNMFMSASSSLIYSSDKYQSTSGISYSRYIGDHIGRVLWSMYNQNISNEHMWYFNDARKTDFNIYSRHELKATKWLYLYADLQFRRVALNMDGPDKDFVSLLYKKHYNFFNPKFGLTFDLSKSSKLYASVAIGRKEPGRADIKESIKAGKADLVKPERLTDYEFGYMYSGEKLTLAANVYMMEYKDQLVPTGKLSETGYVIKENVPHSYRRGIEFSAAYSPAPFIRFDGNLTLSKNKIIDYTSWRDLYDNPNDWTPMPQTNRFFSTTNIAYSPECVSAASMTISPDKHTKLMLNAKYVGKQYYDNTSDENFSIPSYYVMSFNASRAFKIKREGDFTLSLFVDNLLNRKYFSNAWVYNAGFADGSALYIEEGLFPQAEINFNIKASFRF